MGLKSHGRVWFDSNTHSCVLRTHLDVMNKIFVDVVGPGGCLTHAIAVITKALRDHEYAVTVGDFISKPTGVGWVNDVIKQTMGNSGWQVDVSVNEQPWGG